MTKDFSSFPRNTPDRPSSGRLSWIADLQHFNQAISRRRARQEGARTASLLRLFYRLEWDVLSRQGGQTVARIAFLKGRDESALKPWLASARVLSKPPAFLTQEDIAILRLLLSLNRLKDKDGAGVSVLPLDFPASALAALAPVDDADQAIGGELTGLASGAPLSAVFRQMLATKRLVAGEPPVILNEGLPRQMADVRQALAADADGLSAAMTLIDAQVPWYLDWREGSLGPMLISTSENGVVPVSAAPRVLQAPLSGRLVLATLKVRRFLPWRGYVGEGEERGGKKAILSSRRCAPHDGTRGLLDYAEAFFCYGDVTLAPDDPRVLARLPDGEQAVIARAKKAEEDLMAALLAEGFQSVPADRMPGCAGRPRRMMALESEAAWADFMDQGIARLVAAGWEVVHAPDFRHALHEVEAWEVDGYEENGDRFGLNMGVRVAGERLPLAPMLADLLHREPRWLDAFALGDIHDDEVINLFAEDGRRLCVPASRLKPLARLVIDLFDNYRKGEVVLRISRFDAARLDIFRDPRRWQFQGDATVLSFMRRLKASHGIREVEPPKGLCLALRDYQRRGLAWLQYLREQGISGILADDMGLGKTAQTLAHLLTEKEAGRLTQPALIVLPTSLIFNWKNEASRFGPSLKVLSLHGQNREQLFANIPAADVVLTTYPLLWRDGKALAQYDYYLLVLDEAQMVKNAKSKSAAIVRQLRAQHRLCLTGTPLENHLGELWAQFDFLLPGFLGDQKTFTRLWRYPIEKRGDALRLSILARRIQPFILRRKKDEVARELPKKTIIVRRVALSGGQRDLYEAVRAAMDDKVRAEIARRGLMRSHIIILDALLKLRQVCCDPRLVRSAAARRVIESAKLDLLMDMLPEMVAEGRRILLFSQFTTMLDLIRHALEAEGLSYALLTGATKDREMQVAAFQNGEVPIFLVGLKAGGVGLNLTAADTVIHYDPWWNPAAENQATDRVHRLGQDKPIFVYKLIVAGSIEEKILALQEEKAGLASILFSGGERGEMPFVAGDVESLFEPLPG